MGNNIKDELNKKIEKDLINLSDKKYKEFHSGLCPNTNNILGVRNPVLKQYAKDLYLENPEINPFDIEDKYYEQIMLQGLLICQNKKKDFKTLEKELNTFVPKIYNWAICDTFCSGLKITKKYKKEMKEKVINKYLKSKKEFELRFSLVMLLAYYIDDENIDDTLNIYLNTKSDFYYVKMAVAWGLSFCLIKYFDKTIKALKDCKLDDFTYNKALQKGIESYRLTDKQKDILRKMKR